MTNSTIALFDEPALSAFLGKVIQVFFNTPATRRLSPEQEEKLISRAAHDPQAFDDLYRQYVDRVYAYHLVRSNSREEAEDLTSQTFLSALEGIGGYRRESSFPIWLFGIARRKLADHYRQPASLPLEMAEDPDSGLEDAVDHRLRLQEISRALMKIDPDRVEALSLRIFGQLNTAEISRLLSKSEGAVRNLVYRALQDLRRHLVIEKELEEK